MVQISKPLCAISWHRGGETFKIHMKVTVSLDFPKFYVNFMIVFKEG